MRKPKATIECLPLEVNFMIIERLRLKDALNMAKALKLPEQVAVQYFACGRIDLEDILHHEEFYDLHPSSYKFLLKNECFQIGAVTDVKTWAAIRTLDLDFVKKYFEQVKPDLTFALREAAWIGFTDVVKLLLSDYGVDPSPFALILASEEGHSEIV
jgi:hypothetical protein